MKHWFSEDKNIRLYNGDCLEVMDKLIENGIKVDLIICDPAYKITQRGGRTTAGGMLLNSSTRKGDVFENNDCHVSKWCKMVYELLNDGSHCYIMTNNANIIEFLIELQKCGFHFVKNVIWNKGNKIMSQMYMSQYEYIIFLRKGKAKKINNCGTSDILNIPNKKQKGVDGKNLHDTEKPVDLMKILIENSSNEGDLVLDFMMGIGSTGVACKNLNRKFIGVELDEKYFEIAVKRVNKEV